MHATTLLQNAAAATGSAMARRFLIGGHRGVGENLFLEKATAPPSSASVIPEFRENTIHSFLRAADCGVDFVEFDVQVTRDNHAVLWHDDTVVQQRHLEQGMPVVATAVKDMTLDAFRHVVGSTAPSARLVRHFRGAASRSPLPQEVLPWDCAVEDQLPTLEEVFRAVPKRVAFDVEIKMTEGDDVERTPPEEVERVVNCIWDVVRQHGRHGPEAAPAAEAAASTAAAAAGRSEVPEDHASASGAPARRDLFFSSFDPDVCEAIRMKQGEYDVYFLSGCGLYQHVDSRRTSIAAALAFASDKHLSGVVLPAQVLLANPGMVEEAAAMGLKLMTYGLENDESESISKQQGLGISGAIVDDVQSLMSRHARAVQTAAA